VVRLKILNFIAKEEVFKALVERKSADGYDTKSLVTSTGGNVWNWLKFNYVGWPDIWAFVYKKNIRGLSYSKGFSEVALLPLGLSWWTSSNPSWGFLYKGPKDIHVSALWPVDVTPPDDMTMKFADQNYFKIWHTLKNP